MAGLSLVASWVLKSSGLNDVQDPTILQLREPAPPPPGLLERLWLRQRIPRHPELTAETGTLHQHQHAVLPTASSSVQFSRLMAFYEDSVDVAAQVCRVVVEREAMTTDEAASFEQLVLSMGVISQARPSRVPRSICLALEALGSARSAVVQRLSTSEDAGPFVLDAKTQLTAERIVSWFDEAYLGRSLLERRGLRWAAVGSAILFCGWLVREAGLSDGRVEARAESRRALCGPSSAEALTKVCAGSSVAAASK